MAYLSFPHKPEFENIGPSTALDMFISSVVGHVIELVLLEKVRGTGTVGRLQNPTVSGHKHRTLLRRS